MNALTWAALAEVPRTLIDAVMLNDASGGTRLRAVTVVVGGAEPDARQSTTLPVKTPPLMKDIPLGADIKEFAFVRSTGQVHLKLFGRISKIVQTIITGRKEIS